MGDLIFSRLEDPGGGSEHSHDDGHDHGALTPEELLREADEATAPSAEPLDFAGGESPVVAINRPLLEAYNAMWSAGRELGVGADSRLAYALVTAYRDAVGGRASPGFSALLLGKERRTDQCDDSE